MLKAAEDNLQRLEKVVGIGQRAGGRIRKGQKRSEPIARRVETERIERDRNLQIARRNNEKIGSPDEERGNPLTDGRPAHYVQTIDGELVADGNELFTVSSRKNYVRGEVNEEDVGEVKPEMKAKVQLYAYRTQTFTAHVSSVQPAADPTTQRYTVVLEMENPPDNLMAGMTGEMNIITGTHENALAGADARAACRSGIGGETRHCAAHAPSKSDFARWISLKR